MSSLLERLHAPSDDLRLVAIREALGTIEEDIARTLVDLAANGNLADPLRQAAAESLATSSLVVISDLLIPLKNSPFAFTRTMAALGLGGQSSAAAILSLIEGLTDPVNTVRNWSERSLIGQIPAVREFGVEALIALLTHPTPLSRSPAARILGLTRDPRCLPALLRMGKEDTEWLARMWAIRGLGDLGLPEANELVIDRLRNDPKNRVRAAAAESLGKLRPDGVEALLRQALESDDDEGVEKSVGEALQSLGFDVSEINDDGWDSPATHF